MSLHATAWAFRQQPETPLMKLLLIAMGDGACDDGWVKAAFDRWASFACTSPDDTRQSVQDLEDSGYLTVHPDGIRIACSPDHASPHGCPWIVHEPPPRDGRRAMSASTRAFVFERDGYTCAYCDDTAGPFEVDHVMPVSRGGGNELENLVCACKPCNRSKAAKTVEEWVRA